MVRGRLALEKDERAAWGTYQGTASEPYHVAIGRNRQAYHCSCPSPRVPCKHARDLLGRLTVEPATFKETEPPQWVADWIIQRRARAERSTPADPERAEADQRKRADRRT